MGSEWVDGGPSLGSALSGVFGQFTAAPGKALDNIMTAEQIKALRAKQGYDAATAAQNAAAAAREDEIFKAQRAAADAFSGTIPSAVAPEHTQTVPGPFVGNISDPGATQGLPTVDLTYTLPGEAAQAEKDRTFFDKYGRAIAYKSPKDLPSAYANTQVGVGGVPTDQGRKEQLQYLQTGKFDKPESKPFVVIDPATKEVVRVYASGDGGRTDIAGNDMVKQYGAKYQIAPASTVDPSAAPKSIFDSKGQTQNALVGAANDIASGRRLPNEDQTRVLALGLSNEYPAIKKVLSDAIGNTIQLDNFIEKEAPPALRPLLRHIANTLPEYKPAAAATGTPAADSAQPRLTQDPITGAPLPSPAAATDVTSLSPPQTTTILSAAPADKATVDAVRAIQMASADRAIVEDVLGVQNDASGRPVMTKPEGVPGWKATIIRETMGGGTLGNAILNMTDPNAKRYMVAARSWIEPVLRIATGAVAHPYEVTGYMERFVPDVTDSPQVKAEKITRMRVWEEATRTAANANEAIKKILSNPQANAADREMAERMRVRAADAGTLTAPVGTLGPLGSARGTGAVTTAAPPDDVSPRATGPSGRPSAEEIVKGRR